MIVEAAQPNPELEILLNWDFIERKGIVVENISLMTELQNRSKHSHIKSAKVFSIEMQTNGRKDIFYVALISCANEGKNYTVKQFFNKYPSDQYLHDKFSIRV